MTLTELSSRSRIRQLIRLTGPVLPPQHRLSRSSGFVDASDSRIVWSGFNEFRIFFRLVSNRQHRGDEGIQFRPDSPFPLVQS